MAFSKQQLQKFADLIKIDISDEQLEKMYAPRNYVYKANGDFSIKKKGKTYTVTKKV